MATLAGVNHSDIYIDKAYTQDIDEMSYATAATEKGERVEKVHRIPLVMPSK